MAKPLDSSKDSSTHLFPRSHIWEGRARSGGGDGGGDGDDGSDSDDTEGED